MVVIAMCISHTHLIFHTRHWDSGSLAMKYLGIPVDEIRIRNSVWKATENGQIRYK